MRSLFRIFSSVAEIKRSLLVILAICVAASISSAKAEPPSVKLLTAPLVTPTSAWTFYGSGTTHTTGSIGWTSTTRPVEIKELARSLSLGGAVTGDAYAAKVDEYVRKNIEIEFRFGLSKGARGALIDQSGTAFDQAHLMVELLREGGSTADYQVGTITLNASQFYDWTGLTDAKASCQYLADGGIPATVNSATSCSGLTGSLTTVSLGHIWVSTGGKLYDPAYKKHLFKTGIDLAAAAGCGTSAAPTCGTTIAGLIPAQTLLAGTTNIYKIQSVPEATINAQLKTYAINMQNWIQNYNGANNTNLALEDVIGGSVLDTSAIFNATPTLPYTSTTQYSWTGDIPDQYRTTLRTQLDNIDQTLFVDELAGKRLRIWGQAGGLNTTSYSRTLALYAEYKPLAKSTKATATPSDAVLTLTANHPYAANSGSYMDEAIQRATQFGYGSDVHTNCCWLNTLTILNGWGDNTQSSVSHFGALQLRDVNSTAAEDISNTNHYWFFKPYQYGLTFLLACVTGTASSTPSATPAPDPGCYEQHQQTLATSWLAQVSQTQRMIAQISGAKVQSHHSLGWLLSGEDKHVTQFNAEASLSAVSKTATGGSRQATFFGISAAVDRLEGSVFEQQFDSWDGSSAVSYLVRSNSQGIATLWVDSGNIGTALTKLTNYSADRQTTLQTYSTAGYGQIVPQNGYLGNFSYSTGNTLTLNTNATAAYALAGDRVAFLVNGLFKGSFAGSAQSPSDAALTAIKEMNYSVKAKKYYGINQENGDFSLSPPPDIVSGTGAFPLSLPYRRSYNSSTPLDALDGSNYVAGGAREYQGWQSHEQTVSDLGGGWSHNYDVSAKMGSDGFKSLGIDSAREASAAIVALFTAARLNDGSLTFGSHLATIFATNWWIARLQNNIVTVRQPPKTSVFTRLPDDSNFAASPGSADVLTQSGNRVFTGWLANLGSAFTYNGVGFSLIDYSGRILTLSYPTSNIYNLTLAVPAALTDPTGVKVAFTNRGDSSCSSNTNGCVYGVVNSLGRSLSFTASDVSDESGRHIYFKTTQSISSAINRTFDANTNYAATWVPSKLIATGLDGQITSYDYLANPMLAINRPYPKITRWFTPLSTVTPYITTDYDALYRAKKVTDNLAHASDYFVSGLYGPENRKPAAVRDPLGNVTLSANVDRGDSAATTDPLGRVSTKVYDNAKRVLREVMPEGNAIEYQYDIRNNVTRTCAIGKGRVDWSTLNRVTEQAPQCNTGLGDLASTTAFVEGPSILSCVNTKICNKPAYEIYTMGNRTDYTYCAPTNADCTIDTGQLRKVTTGLNSGDTCAIGSICPVTTYGYTGFVGSDSATFYLLTSKQERIDPTNAATTTTTTWAYNPSNHWVLKEQVVDSGGLALRSCFKFDAIGNLISKTEPAANLTSCP